MWTMAATGRRVVTRRHCRAERQRQVLKRASKIIENLSAIARARSGSVLHVYPMHTNTLEPRRATALGAATWSCSPPPLP